MLDADIVAFKTYLLWFITFKYCLCLRLLMLIQYHLSIVVGTMTMLHISFKKSDSNKAQAHVKTYLAILHRGIL